MNDKNEALKQALECIERLNKHGWILADFEDEVYATITALKAALEQQQVGPVEDMLLRRAVLRSAKIVSDGRFVTKQAALDIAPPLPVQEAAACRFCHSKKGCWTWQCYKCGEIDDVQKPAPLPVQPEPVKLRRGDILRCIETDELCTVWATSTTNKTLIKWSANNFGNYTAEQIGELFWIEQQAKPMAWDKPSASFDEWWDGDRRRDNANPFATDSFSYWAFEGWQAALAQPVQEPVAWLYPEGLKALQNGKCWTAYPTQHEDCNTPLYIAMPPMPVQEPVARVIDNGTPEGATEWIPFTNRVEPLETGDLLYTAPPKQRQPLAASEILNMMPGSIPAEYDGPLMEFARAVEAKLKELNK